MSFGKPGCENHADDLYSKRYGSNENQKKWVARWSSGSGDEKDVAPRRVADVASGFRKNSLPRFTSS
jgi:hypothetical protein